MNRNSFNRRTFVKRAAGVSLLPGVVIHTGCSQGDVVDRKLKFSNLSEALAEAERLVSVEATAGTSGFSLPQTLIHCAQSIQYSVTGFPEMKPALFQRTVGSAAFHLFAWRNQMAHDLSEAIPGAGPLSVDTSAEAALSQLVAAVALFENAGSPLMPHFAYGKLSREQYVQANAMHLANHFSAIDA